MGTSKDNLVEEVYKLEQEVEELRETNDDLRKFNKDMGEALDQALAQNNKIQNALHEALDIVSYSDYKELESQVEDLEQEVNELKWALENEIPDDYEIVDTVTESTRFELAVEDIVKETLRSVLRKLEDL